MFAPGLIQGRWLGAEDFEALQRLIAEHPHWSRRRLSIALCEALNWRTASGQLKDMSARLLLNKLAERGLIKLPPRCRGGGRRILRALSEPELFSLSAGAEELIEAPLRALQPLEVIALEPRTTQANAFVCHFLGKRCCKTLLPFSFKWQLHIATTFHARRSRPSGRNLSSN